MGLIYKRNPISKSAERLYNKYANKYSLKQLDIDFVKRDVLYSSLKWGIRADEYFRYSFFNLSDHGRKQYVSEYELDLRYKDDPKIIELLNPNRSLEYKPIIF